MKVKAIAIAVLTLASFGFVAASCNPDPQPSLPIHAAFYYPWFPEAWNQQGFNPYTNYTPSNGFYDGSDPAVIAQQIAAMRYGGLDAGIASWWGTGSQTDGRIPLLLDAAKTTPFRWSLYFEQESLGDPSVTSISTALGYIDTHYGHETAYLRVGGKPVIFVYADANDGCGMASRWKQANAGRFYVVLKVFPGYLSCADQPNSWHQYAPSVATDSQPGQSFSVSPGFYKKGEASPRLARNLTRWANNVQAMKDSGAPWQLVTTFNEWGEGTSVESATQWSSASGYGSYLDTLHNILTGGPPPTTTIPSSTTTMPGSTTSAATTTTTSASGGVCGQAGTPATRQKVVVFSFENRTWSGVGGTQFQSMPYLHGLATKCSTFSQYTEPDTGDNSATQYVGQWDGNPSGNTVRSDCSPSSSCQSLQNNIGRQVRDSGGTVRSYVEGTSSTCSASGNAAKHIPALYFRSAADAAACNAEVRPLSDFNPNALASFSFVTPTLCNDGHDCGNSTVDSWAAAHVQPVLNSAAYKAGQVTVFIWYDEDHPVPNMQLSIHANAGVKSQAIDYGSTLRAWEDMLGVAHTGHATNAVDMRPIAGI